MLTARENYLIAAKGGKPERVPVFPEDCNIFMPDFWHERDPETGADFCNVKWEVNDAGEMPRTDWKAMEEIGDWRETVKFPIVSEMDWEGMAQRFRETSDPDKVNIAMLNTNGIFLIPINMLGWVDGLCAICDEPEELEAFVARITDFFIEVLDYIGNYIHPDIVFSGDDFASTTGPFLSRDIFREMYVPYLRKINNKIHEIGALAEFHCCGNCQYLISEFIGDVDTDICQLPEPNLQLESDKAKYGSKLVLTGGWDRHGEGSMPGASEEAVRRSVHTAIDTYGKDGALIFWDGGIIGTSEDSRQKMEWLLDEVHKYGREVYQK